MKTPDDSLFRLIKSLSRNEKGYFKKYSSMHIIGGENNYIRLFDAIEKQKKFNEEAIKKHFSEGKIIKQFSSAKNYLFTLILESLESYNSGMEAELIRQQNYIGILIQKGLYKEAGKVIKKTKV